MLFALIDILKMILSLLIWILIIQAVLSWLIVFNVINTTNDFVRGVVNALDRLTEPLYRPIRRIMPDLGGLDFSPMVVILLLIIAQKLLDGVALEVMRSYA